MKSRFQVFFLTIICLLTCLSKGEIEKPFYRNVRVRIIPKNDTELSVSSRIHGGAFAAEGQFKYMVFLLSYGSKNNWFPDYTCSASLIHPSWVLTAAHCVSPAMIAVAGKANLLDYWSRGRSKIPFAENIDEKMFQVQERKVRRVFVHPKYSTITNERDFALLLLDSPFNTFSNHEAPVEVLHLSKREMVAGTMCNAIGWGLNDHQKQTFRLMFASVYAKSTAVGCYYQKHGPFICLEMGGAGICKGDSGSPLVCEAKAWGVASFSLSPADKSDCLTDSEEYYSEIYKELDWIKETMSNGTILISCHNYFGLLIFVFFHIFKATSS